jgi:hypothetical protein
MARHDERQIDTMQLLGLKRQALARRLRGETAWARWELSELARHWGIGINDLVGENAENHTSGTAES